MRPLRLGIGIATFDRAETLARTLAAVRRFTETPHRLVVADDGSADGTLALLRRERVSHIAGRNRGVAWNKNRLLYGLAEMLGCEIVLLLEDDTVPIAAGWERPWMEAARLHGHANLAGDWMRDHLGAGSGTPTAPFRATMTSGQCAVFSRAALAAAGFMDTRFGRYGYEHAEQTERLVKAGFGGDPATGEAFLIESALAVGEGDAHRHVQALEEAGRIYHELKRTDLTLYRPAWRSEAERSILRTELRRARLYGQARLSPLRWWRTAAPVMRRAESRRSRRAVRALRAMLAGTGYPSW